MGKGALLVVNVYLARTLGVANYGMLALAQSIASCLWIAADMGINLYGIREIAKSKARAEEIINPLFTVRILSGLVVSSMYVVCIFICKMPSLQRLTFLGCGAYVITYSCYTDWVLKGFERFRFSAYGSLVTAAAFLVGTVVFVRSNGDVGKASFVWATSYFCGSLSLMYFVQTRLGVKFRPVFNVSVWLLHIRESKFFMFSGILMVLYQNLPIYLLGILLDSHVVGLFAAPYRVILSVSTASMLVTAAFYPVFSELATKDKFLFIETHRLLQKIMVAFGLPGALLGTLFSKEIIGLLFGSDYHGSILIFRMLIWVVPMSLFRYSYGTVLLTAGLQKQHNLVALIGLISATAIGTIIVPKMQIVGGAVTVVISEGVMIGAMLIISRKVLRKVGLG
jgi:PST family polysaccharide transporter